MKKNLAFVTLCIARLALNPAFADEAPPNRQGEALNCNYPASYNAPGAIAVAHASGKNCAGDTCFFADASFTYWYLSEEGLRVATNSVLNGSTLAFSHTTNGYFPSFNYHPGFKVGLGMTHGNEWVSHMEYTWVHANTRTSLASPVSGSNLPAGTTTTAAGTSVYAIDDWFLQGSSGGQALAASAISSTWKLDMNIVDLTWGRPWYQGQKLIMSAMGGVELAFISQHMNISLTQATGQLSSLPAQPINSHNNSDSWGVGVLAGSTCKVLLPSHFYLEGSGAFALLYTHYTVKHKEDAASTSFNAGPYTASYEGYYAVRPNANLNLGLGWGRYFRNDAYYADLGASYEFSIYWAQNMMRKLLDDVLVGISAAPADLFTQGLTLTATLHF